MIKKELSKPQIDCKKLSDAELDHISGGRRYCNGAFCYDDGE